MNQTDIEFLHRVLITMEALYLDVLNNQGLPDLSYTDIMRQFEDFVYGLSADG